MVTVCRGVADWELWMMRLEPPREVMVGTVSTLTERGINKKPQMLKIQLLMLLVQKIKCLWLTLDFCVLPVLLEFALVDDGGRLGDDCAQGPCGNLLQDVDSLDSRLGGAGAHWRGHGIGHWFDGLR